jgi:hypothetical protein
LGWVKIKAFSHSNKSEKGNLVMTPRTTTAQFS